MSKVFKTFIIGFFFVSFLFLTNDSDKVMAQTSTFSQGVNWQKTIRIRGLLVPLDPFNETLLYNLTQKSSNEIEARSEYIQFELVASRFWISLRDSLEAAAREGRVDLYTIRQSSERRERGIFNRGTRVTYEDMLDTLSVYFDESERIDNQFAQVHSLNTQLGADLQTAPFIPITRLNLDLRRDAVNIGGINRFVHSFEMLTMFELEIVLHVDETGFEIHPQSLLFGNAIWDDVNAFNPDNPNSGYNDLFGDGVGVFVDLTDERTLRFLVESGVQISGETNTIPYFDLITIFHYNYRFYAESNNVIAEASLDFGHDIEELEATLLNRYNDLTYTYLYGQPPNWWEDGGRGHFINGLFEISPDARQRFDQDND